MTAGEGGEEEQPGTCDEGGYLQCAGTAQCVDHPTGFCCQCVAPQFGNGKNCLDPGGCASLDSDWIFAHLENSIKFDWASQLKSVTEPSDQGIFR